VTDGAKHALITGIGGQDGIYLARLLLSNGYTVAGIARHTDEIDRRLVPEKVELVAADVADRARMRELIAERQPDEIYNLASDSFGPRSWDDPLAVGETMALATVNILETIRTATPDTRFFQASSSEMFGAPAERPQRETTPLQPRTPYAAAKTYAHAMVGAYRSRFGVFCCSGILYNHESPLRRAEFVTRKITSSAAAISLGLATELRLGNLDVRRDWGFAGDYVRAMWLMLQQEKPDDYVLSAGQTHSVRDLCDIAFGEVGLDYREFVRYDDRFARPDDVEPFGDSSRAGALLGWRPSVSFRRLIQAMVAADIERLRGNEMAAIEVALKLQDETADHAAAGPQGGMIDHA
jgi:GDPmannose 4,6-dehydratase